jgi:hypothetical protein
MSTPVPGFIAHPLYAAVAFAHFGVPDGYVGPHDSPAAYARAVEAARCRTLYQIRAGFPLSHAVPDTGRILASTAASQVARHRK